MVDRRTRDLYPFFVRVQGPVGGVRGVVDSEMRDDGTLVGRIPR